MLKMLTLIKREIYDHIAYFLGAFIFSMILLIIVISAAYHSNQGNALGLAAALSFPVIVILIIGFTSMGISQMYTDKNKRISAFLLTLPVTRGRIITARVVTGILAVSTFFLPVIITTIIFYRIYAPFAPAYKGMIFDIYTTIISAALSCYCIGLQTGWMTNRILPPLAGLALTFIFASIIIIKGFWPHVWLLLIVFIIASVIRIRQKFMNAPL